MDKPIFETGTTEADLQIDNLVVGLPGDKVFMGVGAYADKAAVEAAFASQTAITTLLGSSAVELGEVAEGEAVKPESKTEAIKTRHYTFPGKRTTSVTINLAGLGSKQKDFFESSNFEGQDAVLIIKHENEDSVCVLNDIRWTVDWTGSDISVSTVTLKAEFAGPTKNRIIIIDDIPEGT